MVALIKEMKERVFADYDADADVLYITHGKPRPGYGDSRDDGIIPRFSDVDGSPIGATIVGYVSCNWDRKRESLAAEVGRHLGISPSEVMRSIEEIGL